MAKKTEEPGFAELVSQVEDALRDLESGELPLEEAMQRYEEGIASLRRCFEILKQAEKKVQVLTERDGTVASQPFDPSEEEPPRKLF